MNKSRPLSGESEAFTRWKSKVNTILRRSYAVDIASVGLDDDRLKSHWCDNQTPEVFVEWYASKYQLTAVMEWGWYEPRSNP
jgi:hypothetical protein